jgi:hypothetical protein
MSLIQPKLERFHGFFLTEMDAGFSSAILITMNPKTGLITIDVVGWENSLARRL